MASTGNMLLNKGIPNVSDAFVVIVKTEWNNEITDALEQGCLSILSQQNIQTKTYVVPGAFEIPFIIKHLSENSSKKIDAVIALGAVIKGDTPHFEYVCNAVTDGVVLLNNQLSFPTIYGILTLNNYQQALERIGGVHGHKGEEAAITAIKMIALQRSI